MSSLDDILRKKKYYDSLKEGKSKQDALLEETLSLRKQISQEKAKTQYNKENNINNIFKTNDTLYNVDNSFKIASSKAANDKISAARQKQENEEFFKSINPVKTPEAFKDGYDRWDITKTILGTAGDVGASLAKGATNAFEGVNDTLLFTASGISNLVGANNLGYALSETARDNTSEREFQNMLAKTGKNSVLSDFGRSIVESAGYSTALAYGGSVLPNGGNIAIKTSKFSANVPVLSVIGGASSGLNQAYSDPNSSSAQKIVKGLTSGIIEGFSESLFGTKIYNKKLGGSTLDDAILKKATRGMEDGFKKVLVSRGIAMGGEATEEIIGGLLEPIANALTNQLGNAKFDTSVNVEEMFKEAAVAALSTALSSGGSQVLMINRTTNNAIKQIEQEQGRKLTSKEKAEVKQQVIQQISSQLTEEQNIPTQQDIQQIQNKAQQEELQQTNAINQPIQENALNEVNNSVIDNTRAINNVNDTLEAKTRQENLENIKTVAYKYESNENNSTFRNNVYESASKVLNNTNESRNFVEAVAKIADEKQTNYRFVNNKILNEMGYKVGDATINGLVDSQGNVLLNVDSAKALNTVLGHETTHLFENSKQYNELKELAINYAKTKGIYDSEMERLTKLYEGTNANIENELVSDIIGDNLFTDEQFIRDLSIQKPTIFQKVRSLIKDLASKFKGKEAQQLRALEKKFEKIYRETNVNNDGNTKYMMTSTKGAENISDIKDRYNKAISMNATNEEIRKETGWFKDKYGNWEFEISDTNTKFKYIPAENTKTTLEKLFDAKTLYKMYPSLKDVEVVFKDMKPQGNYSNATKTISIKNSVLNDLENARGTLLHEIQHFIQHEENLPHGANVKFGRKRYVNKKGEIEAEDTKQRMNLSVEERKQKTPESAKQNPTHPYKDNIMANETKLDKIKDLVYDLIGDVANEKNTNSVIENLQQDIRQIRGDNGRELESSSFSLEQKQNDTKYSLSNVDNKGRELSQQQQEYFKDSKVRDENGNLQTYYNGSDYFNIYDKNKLSDESKWGKGIYLTKYEDVAKMYGEDIKESYVNIINPINQEEKTISFDDFNEFYKAINDGEEAYYEEYEFYNTDLDLLWDYTNKGSWADYAQELKDYLGVDGLIINDETQAEDMIIAFQSNQIKRVDNTNPTTNEDIRYSLSPSGKLQENVKGYNVRGEDVRLQEITNPFNGETIETTNEEIDTTNPYETNIPYNNNEIDAPYQNNLQEQKVETDIQRIERVADELFNNGLPRDAAQDFIDGVVRKYGKEYLPKAKDNQKVTKMIKDLQEKLTNSNAYIDKLAKDTGNMQIRNKADIWNNAMQTASYNINNAQTDIKGNKIGKSINEIFEPAVKANKQDAFNDYLFHKSNVERHSKGVGSVVPSNVSESLIRAYEIDNPEFINWSKDIETYYDNLLQTEVEAGLIDQATYDFFRGENGIYRSYVPFYPGEVDEARYFDNAGEIRPISTLKRSKGNSYDIAPIQESINKQTMAVWNSIRANELYQEVVNTLGGEESIGGMVRNNPTDLSQNLYVDPDGNYYLTAMVDGNEKSAKISKELYNEFNRTNENKIKELEEKYSMIVKPVQKFSEIRKKILTSWNPLFTLYKNPVKDIQDALYYSKHTTDMIKNIPSAYQELYTLNTPEVNQFLAYYGTEGKKGIFKLGEVIELAPRYAEFKASLKNGDTFEQALYNAKDVTTNFGRGGYITKAMNRDGFTFLNASVQGFDKFVRNFSEQPNAKAIAMTVGKAAMLGIVPALFNDLVFSGGDDDKDYEALPDYIKDNYYLVKLPNGQFLRIPKGRALSIMGSAARRTLELGRGDLNAFEGYIDNAWSQIGVGDVGNNNLIAPITQAASNKAWYGGDIVPTRLKDKPAGEQTDASIDAISNFIGDKLNISPYKINYVLDQYSGGFGDILLPMITEETSSGAENPLEYLTAFIKDQNIVDSTNDNKYASEFYTTLEKLKVQNNSYKASDEDQLKYKYMSSISSEMSKLYKERREVQSDTSLSKKQKYEKVQVIQNEINAKAKEGVENYKNLSVNSDYSTINDRTFRKNSKGEWEKPSESDEETTNTLGMTDSEKSTYYKTKSDIQTINADYNSQKKNASDTKKAELSAKQKTDVTNSINKSSLTNAEKYALYNDYYGSEKTSSYLQNANIDFKNYSNAVLEVEKIKETYKNTDNMTSKQKTAQSNLRKQKVQAYLNSQNMPMEQKMMLEHYVGGYSIKGYRTYVEKYIDTLKISENEKAKLWDSLFK